MEISSGSTQIWIVALDQDGGQLKAGKAEPFRKGQVPDGEPAFSSDGHWLAYQSNSSGKNEVYVRAFPDNGSQWQISNNGGFDPRWSPDGRDLLYRSGDQIMAAGYTVKGDAFQSEKQPRGWIAKVGPAQLPGTQWDVDPSGNRVAVITPVDAQGGPHFRAAGKLLRLPSPPRALGKITPLAGQRPKFPVEAPLSDGCLGSGNVWSANRKRSCASQLPYCP